MASTKSRDIAIGVLVPIAVITILLLVIVGVLVTLKVQHKKGGECHNLNYSILDRRKCMLEHN
jgi:hypothetical protein